MKKIFILSILLILCFAKETRADESKFYSLDDFDLAPIENVLESNDYELDIDYVIGEIAKGNVVDVIGDTVKNIIKKSFFDVFSLKQLVISIVLVTIVSSFFTNFASVFSGNGISETGFYVCYIVEISVFITVFNDVGVKSPTLAP